MRPSAQTRAQTLSFSIHPTRLLYQSAQADEYAFYIAHLPAYIQHICTTMSSHHHRAARLKRPAGTADWWGYASHQGIRAPRDAMGTLGVPSTS
ncbi:hypothetical protein P692DRAFT_201182464 [Suillus brevipes Sb2]|nr:hypothetical protein P692DRAFT_201182464 [Suillus brevipes Sb2]